MAPACPAARPPLTTSSALVAPPALAATAAGQSGTADFAIEAGFFDAAEDWGPGPFPPQEEEEEEALVLLPAAAAAAAALGPNHPHYRLGSAASAAEASGLSPAVVASLAAYQSGSASTCKTVGALLAALHAARAAGGGAENGNGNGNGGRAPAAAALDSEAEAVLLAEMEQAEYEQRRQVARDTGAARSAREAALAAAAAAVPPGAAERAAALADAIVALPPVYPTAQAAAAAQVAAAAASRSAAPITGGDQQARQQQQQQQQQQQHRRIAPILGWTRLLRSVLSDWRDFSLASRWRPVTTGGALQLWYRPPPPPPAGGHPRGHPPPRGGNVHAFKGACVLEFPLERIVALAAETDLVTAWNTSFTEFSALGWLSPHEAVVRMSLWTPWPLTPPEMVMHAAGFDLLDSPEGCLIVAIDQPPVPLMVAVGAARPGKGQPTPPAAPGAAAPPAQKRDRMRTCPSCYRFEPLPPHPVTGAPRTHATVMMQIDAGSVQVPEMVLRFVLTMLAPTVHRLVLKTLTRLFGGGGGGGAGGGGGPAASAASGGASGGGAAAAGASGLASEGGAALASQLLARVAARPELYEAIRRRSDRRVAGMAAGAVPLGEAGAALASGGFGGAPGGGMLTPAELAMAQQQQQQQQQQNQQQHKQPLASGGGGVPAHAAA